VIVEYPNTTEKLHYLVNNRNTCSRLSLVL